MQISIHVCSMLFLVIGQLGTIQNNGSYLCPFLREATKTMRLRFLIKKNKPKFKILTHTFPIKLVVMLQQMYELSIIFFFTVNINRVYIIF